MKKFFTMVTLFAAVAAFACAASAMDIKLGQTVEVTDSNAFPSTPVAKNYTFLELKGAELFGNNQVILSFEMYFTDEDKKDVKSLGNTIPTYKVIIDRVDSLKEVPGIKATK